MNPGTKIEIIDAETLSSTPITKGRHIVEGLLPQGISLLCGPIKSSVIGIFLGSRSVLMR